MKAFFLIFSPKDSVCLTHDIKRGDILVLSTDGLFDNLYEDEIALIIENNLSCIEKSGKEMGDKEDYGTEFNSKKINNPFPQTAASNIFLKSVKHDSAFKKTKPITNELLNSTGDLLVQKACNGNILL